jgi:uncharacterized protein
VPFLTSGGHIVRPLVRKKEGAPEGSIFWDPDSGTIDGSALEGVDAVIHLAGESISRRWTRALKKRILDSRAKGTKLLADALAKLTRPPKVLVSTSAIGIYGDRAGSETLDETAAPASDDFLADVCKQWEAATAPAAAAGIRVVELRVGIVLSGAGGALKEMLTPFKLGLGGKIGSGKQVMSWIDIDDLVFAYQQALFDTSLSGPVNAVAPNPVTNREFSKTLGHVLHRPSFAPLPGFVVKLMFGEMGKSLLLGGARVAPARLAGAGFQFAHPTLEDALRHQLGR